MKILLFGASGQVGSLLRHSLIGIGDVIAPARRGASGSADFDDPAVIAQTVRTLRPDVIVNAAAWTAVDAAELAADAAFRVNAHSPAALSIEAARLGALLVHYSSDYVFSGAGTRPWREDDPTGPLNVYGASKLAGEEAIRASGCMHLILRTSGVWSPASDNNFVSKVRARLLAGQALAVVDDQIGAPTPAALVADVTARLLPRIVAEPALGGTWHLAAGGETSWFGVAAFIADCLRARGHAVPEVRPVRSADRPSAARRPLNSRLDTTRLRSTFGVALPDWRDPIAQAIAQATAQTIAHPIGTWPPPP